MDDDLMKFLPGDGKSMVLHRVGPDGQPIKPAQMEITVHGWTALVRCSCGTTYTAVMPADGQQKEMDCPSGCGGGLHMDRRMTFEPARAPEMDKSFAEWERYLVDVLSRGMMEGIGTFEEWAERQIERAASMTPDDICAARERAGLPVTEAFRKSLGKPQWKPGEPCDHPGCLNHASHPCEGCGRQWSKVMRVCKVCGGSKWGPNDGMVATEIVCQGCGYSAENSRWVGVEKPKLCEMCGGRGKVGERSPFEGTSLPGDVEEYQAMARSGTLERNCPACGGGGYAREEPVDVGQMVTDGFRKRLKDPDDGT